MESLPDELLQYVLSLVGGADPPTLLDASRVNRRWLRVARDPRTWLRVHVRVLGDGKEGARQQARVLLRAPAVGGLRVRVSASVRRSLGALARGRVVVHGKLEAVWEDSSGVEALRHAVPGLLWRSRRCLRRLVLAPDRHHRFRPLADRERRTFFTILAGMECLEKLSIDVRRVGAYDGELAAARLPTLRDLTVVDVREDLLPLLDDLVRAAGAAGPSRLEALAVKWSCSSADDGALGACPHAAVLDAVDLCPDLRRVGAYANLDFCEALVSRLASSAGAPQRVRDLFLSWFFKAGGRGELDRCAAVVRRCGALPALGSLTLLLGGPLADGVCRDVERLAAELRTRRPDVSVELKAFVPYLYPA